MNKVYDNGYKLLGAKKDIINQIYNNMLVEEQDELCQEILEDLKDIEDNSIIVLNYDNGMGYTIDYWTSKDEVK